MSTMAAAGIGLVLLVIAVVFLMAVLAHGAAPARCQMCGLDLPDTNLSAEYCVLCLAERARVQQRHQIRNDVREYVQRRQKKAGT